MADKADDAAEIIGHGFIHGEGLRHRDLEPVAITLRQRFNFGQRVIAFAGFQLRSQLAGELDIRI